MAAAQAVREDPRRFQGPPAFRPARRPALCQRRYPHRARGQQDSQGHHRPLENAGRFRCALCAGLGLPRPADRAPDREDPRQGPAGRQGARSLPRLRGRAGRTAEEGFHPPRRARRLGPALPDDEPPDRGRRNPRARPHVRSRLRVQGPEAGQLVFRLRFGAGRSRSRIPGQAIAGDRRGISPGGQRTPAAGEGIRPGSPRHGRFRPTRRSTCIRNSSIRLSIPHAG